MGWLLPTAIAFALGFIAGVMLILWLTPDEALRDDEPAWEDGEDAAYLGRD